MQVRGCTSNRQADKPIARLTSQFPQMGDLPMKTDRSYVRTMHRAIWRSLGDCLTRPHAGSREKIRTRAILLLVGSLALVTPASAGRLRLKRPRGAVQMRMTPFAIPAETDLEGCDYMAMPNKQAIDVAAFQLNATAQSHHFIV